MKFAVMSAKYLNIYTPLGVSPDTKQYIELLNKTFGLSIYAIFLRTTSLIYAKYLS